MRKPLFILLLSVIIFSCGKTKTPDSPAVAKVGRSVLKQEQLDRMLLSTSDKFYNENDVVSSWVDRELLYLAASEAGIENDETLQSQIETYRKALIGRTFMDNYIATNITVNNSEIRNYYDNNRETFKRKNDGAKIIHFIVQDDTLAEYIAETLQNTKKDVDRKALLSNYMVDVIDVEKGSLIPELDNALFSSGLHSNFIGPIVSVYGYHIIEVLDRYYSGSQIDLDKSYDEIYQIIYNNKKQKRAVMLIDSLRNHYNVKLYLENN